MPLDSGPAIGGRPNPGSQSALRELNKQRLVDALLSNGPSSQAKLSRQTGLSSATVSNLVKVMSAAGVVETSPTTSSGRRAISVRLSNTGAVAVGVDFGRRHVRVVVATLGFHIIAEENIELPLGHLAHDGLDRASALIGRLLEENSVSPESVLGVGVGIPGPIDRSTGTVVQGAILPEWVGVNLSVLEDRLRFPVHFDNDANLGALAQITWGPHGTVDNLMFVKIGTGIGGGLILNGRTHYGHLGITGEVGHGTISDLGAVCHCGNRGCLETVASTSVMIELLSRGALPTVTTSDIVRNARAGDPGTLRVLDDAGTAIGRSLAAAANLVGPEVIVVGGPLAGLGDLFLAPIARGFLRYAVPRVGDSTRLVMSSLGERSEVLGAASLVIRHQGIART